MNTSDQAPTVITWSWDRKTIIAGSSQSIFIVKSHALLIHRITTL